MKNIRKQLQQLSILAQIILQFRMSYSQKFNQHLNQVLKKINQINIVNAQNSAISKLLIEQQQYGLKNKLYKFVQEQKFKKEKIICLEVRLLVAERSTGQLMNQQTWQFMLGISQISKQKNYQKAGNLCSREEAIIQIIKFLLTHLKSFRLFFVDGTSKNIKNKYMLSNKISITQNFQNIGLRNYENMSKCQVCPTKQINLTANYYYNNSKTQEFLKLFLQQKYIQNFQQYKQYSKKASTNSTQSTKGISFYERYDSQLDITILTNSDNRQEHYKQIVLMETFQYGIDNEQFQLLIQQDQNKDQEFLKDNLQKFKQLDSLMNKLDFIY